MSTVPIREADVQISNNQKDFVIKVRDCMLLSTQCEAASPWAKGLQALLEEVRIDGRRPLDYRKTSFQYTLDDKSCTVLLGQTRVLSVVTAELEAPYPDRQGKHALHAQSNDVLYQRLSCLSLCLSINMQLHSAAVCTDLTRGA